MTVIVSIARGHDSSTTLMVDGKIIFYLEEERITRCKHDGSPLMGLLKVFDYVDHIDHLVVCHTHRQGPRIDWTNEDLYDGFIRKLARKKFDYKTHFVNGHHHKMHAACAFYNSGFETAACVVADGAGSFRSNFKPETKNGGEFTAFEFESIFKADYVNNNDIFENVYKHLGTDACVGLREFKPNHFLSEYPGITKAYESVTEYCGFTYIDAGKVMGLSPYGKPNDDIPDFFSDDGWVNRSLVTPNYPNGADLNIQRYPVLKKEDDNSETYTEIMKDLAYKVQEQTSDRMVEMIRHAHEMTGEKNIVISGGYGLNCVANYEYWKEFPDLNIYCEPISNDGGTSIGGAKHLWAQLSEKRTPYQKQESIYYGPQYHPADYLKDLESLEVTDTSYDDIAQLIRNGNIVTIYQGRSEGGPRALGNRSILFDPTAKNGKDHVNKVKRREWFRPFACSIKKEKVHEWFDLAGRDESPYMMFAVKCHDGVDKKIPSVIHVDNTCRIQTVTQNQNEHYYNLIDAFDKITGVPILFNTSFNLAGDPLVETVDDAIDTLKRSEIEYMYLPEIQKLVYVPNENT